MDTKDVDRFRLRFMNNHMKLSESELAHNRRKGNSEVDRLAEQIRLAASKDSTIIDEWEGEGY